MAPNVGNNGSLRSRWSKNEKRFMQIPLTWSSFHTADKHGDDTLVKVLHVSLTRLYTSLAPGNEVTKFSDAQPRNRGGRATSFPGISRLAPLVVAAPPTKLLPRANNTASHAGYRCHEKYLEAKYVQSILDRLKLGIPLRLSPSPVPIQAFGQWGSEQSNPLAFFLSPLFASLPTDQNAWNSSRCLLQLIGLGQVRVVFNFTQCLSPSRSIIKTILINGYRGELQENLTKCWG